MYAQHPSLLLQWLHGFHVIISLGNTKAHSAALMVLTVKEQLPDIAHAMHAHPASAFSASLALTARSGELTAAL
jgi:hypothetical protein